MRVVASTPASSARSSRTISMNESKVPDSSPGPKTSSGSVGQVGGGLGPRGRALAVGADQVEQLVECSGTRSASLPALVMTAIPSMPTFNSTMLFMPLAKQVPPSPVVLDLAGGVGNVGLAFTEQLEAVARAGGRPRSPTPPGADVLEQLGHYGSRWASTVEEPEMFTSPPTLSRGRAEACSSITASAMAAAVEGEAHENHRSGTKWPHRRCESPCGVGVLSSRSCLAALTGRSGHGLARYPARRS